MGGKLNEWEEDKGWGVRRMRESQREIEDKLPIISGDAESGVDLQNGEKSGISIQGDLHERGMELVRGEMEGGALRKWNTQ